MNVSRKVSFYLSAVIMLLMSVVTATHADDKLMVMKQNEAIRQLNKFAKERRASAKSIVTGASNYAPEVIYQANVLQYPKRTSNNRKYATDFIALVFRSEEVITDMLCLRAANRGYWCQVTPDLPRKDVRQITAVTDSDIERLVVLAFYNGAEVRPMPSARIEKLAPKLANQLNKIDIEKNINVGDIVSLYYSYTFMLGSLNNPVKNILFSPYINLQAYRDVRHIRDRKSYSSDELVKILNQI